MANRALQAKADRAKRQSIAFGINEASKASNLNGNDRNLSKSDLRAIAAMVDPTMVKRDRKLIVINEPEMVLYNPRHHQTKPTAAMLAMVSCDGELVKKGDYRAR